ncbi:MAG TPA: hypothetical protein VH208_04390 [Myxococcaceae bacterium]|nr:hypothetical protein [Myxococcaceae bacterium]
MKQLDSLHRSSVSFADIVDRVLDKGVVVDYQSRLLVSGIDVFTRVDARFVVVSFETYLKRRADVSAALRDPDRAPASSPAPAFKGRWH